MLCPCLPLGSNAHDPCVISVGLALEGAALIVNNSLIGIMLPPDSLFAIFEQGICSPWFRVFVCQGGPVALVMELSDKVIRGD